ADQVTIFHRAGRILRGEDALLVETSQQPVSADHEQLITIGIGAAEYSAVDPHLEGGCPCQGEIVRGRHLRQELIGMFLHRIVQRGKAEAGIIGVLQLRYLRVFSYRFGADGAQKGQLVAPPGIIPVVGVIEIVGQSYADSIDIRLPWKGVGGDDCQRIDIQKAGTRLLYEYGPALVGRQAIQQSRHKADVDIRGILFVKIEARVDPEGRVKNIR